MATLSVRVDDDVKREADSLFESLGMNTTVAVNLFLRRCIRCEGLPFPVTREPNAETLAALQEVQAMKRNPSAYRSYSTADELFDELLR